MPPQRGRRQTQLATKFCYSFSPARRTVATAVQPGAQSEVGWQPHPQLRRGGLELPVERLGQGDVRLVGLHCRHTAGTAGTRKKGQHHSSRLGCGANPAQRSPAACSSLRASTAGLPGGWVAPPRSWPISPPPPAPKAARLPNSLFLGRHIRYISIWLHRPCQMRLVQVRLNP